MIPDWMPALLTNQSYKGVERGAREQDVRTALGEPDYYEPPRRKNSAAILLYGGMQVYVEGGLVTGFSIYLRDHIGGMSLPRFDEVRSLTARLGVPVRQLDRFGSGGGPYLVTRSGVDLAFERDTLASVSVYEPRIRNWERATELK